MLRATWEAGLKMKAIKPSDFAGMNVGTTVQTKEIRFPTEVRLCDRVRERLVNPPQQASI